MTINNRAFAIPLICAAFLAALPAAAQVEPLVVPGSFPANPGPAMGGGIYPVLTGPSVVNGNEAAGQVTFDLRRHFQYEDDFLRTLDPSLTVIYTIDGKPVSPRIKAPYTFVWDSTTVPDGGHVASMILVDGADPPTTDAPSATTFNVVNTGKPVLGPQSLPSIGGGSLRVWQKTGVPEWIPWNTGYTWPHPATTAAFSAPVTPTAASRSLPDGGLSLGFTSESLIQSNVSMEQTGLQVVRSQTGWLEIESNFPEVTASDDTSIAGVMARPMIDGPRNDNSVSPYTTYADDPSGFFMGISLDGRMFTLARNGTITTVAGRQWNRNVVPYSVNDPRVTEADRETQINMIGTFQGGLAFYGPDDLAVDPRNSKIWYVADTGNDLIRRVDFTVTPPAITNYAGTPKVAGNQDGAPGTAQFNGPTSIAVDSDDTIYVADAGNNAIRAIAQNADGTPGAVRTLVNATQGLSQPFTVRFDSHGNLVFVELTAGNVKRLDPGTLAVTLIKASACGAPWAWLDVDKEGALGPVDDMFVPCDLGGNNSTMWRISADGTRMANVPFNAGHYPWAVAHKANEGQIITAGFGDTAPHLYRLPIASDPVYGNYTANQVWPILNRIGPWFDPWGTLPEFPMGARPAQSALRNNGYSTFPGVKSYDDVAGLPADQIAAFITGGLGGGMPRPEITGWDLALAVQDIQQDSMLFPNPLFPMLPPRPTDTTPPVISNVQTTAIDGVTVKVTWATDKPSLGYARFGSSVNYFRWSDIETGFGTAHSVTMANLPENHLEHFAIVAEDVNSNFTMTPDHTVQTGSIGPPPPAPTATLTASPTSITAGQSALLTWASTNATACPGTGFPGGGPSGTATVTPPATTTYSVTCTGLGGMSPSASATVTVTQPPPTYPISVGSQVKTTAALDVYATPATSKICTQKTGTIGKVTGGPQTVGGNTWWQVSYQAGTKPGCSGWSIYQTLVPSP